MGPELPPKPSPEESEAISLFATFLGELESGRKPDLEELCRSHPEHATILRELWEERDVVGPLVEAAMQSAGNSLFGSHAPGSLAPAAGLEPGDDLGEFRLIEILGQGGMGQVWRAEQRSLSRQVALKLIRPGRVSERALELFAREARAGARLSHPGIVTVYGRGTTDGRAWIAMELVQGSWTLRDHLKQVHGSTRGPEDHRKAADFIAQVADALDHAHSAGVMHRDVKPQNILVDEDERPRLTDFGLARIVDEATLSQTGDLLGTYYYMSPEQVAANRSGIDFRTDIFSLGVVLYEMLALRRPFEGETTHQIADQILAYDPPDLRTLGEHIPRDLAVICAKAMQKGRRHRYQTMAEMAADLRRHLEHLPILARPLSPPARMDRWVRRHQTVSAAAGAAMAVAATFAVWLAMGPGTVLSAPFSGPKTARNILIGGPALEASPTFAGPGQVVYERRESPGAQPALWQLNLDADRRPAPLTEHGLAARTPAASPDGRWLAYIEPAPEESEAAGEKPTATRLFIRALDQAPGGILRLGTGSEVLAAPDTLFEGVLWAPDSLSFVYTRRMGQRDTLVLHEHDTHVERELVSMDEGPFAAIPVSFSPSGDRIAFVRGEALEVLDLGSVGAQPSTWAADLGGEVRDLVWLPGDRVLVTHWTLFEDQLRLKELVDGELRLLEELELQGVGDSHDLAIDSTGERLAWVGRPNRFNLHLRQCTGDPRDRVERVDYKPLHLTWTPDGQGLVYGAELPEGFRMFHHELGSAVDSDIPIDVPGLPPGSQLATLAPAFSASGNGLVLRAKAVVDGESRYWIVILPWPPGTGAPLILSLEGRELFFPHVDDEGRRLVWTERTEDDDDTRIVMGARIEAGRVVEIQEQLRGAHNMARISGDGQLIAATVDRKMVVVGWGGVDPRTVADVGNNLIPMWHPDGLFYMRGSSTMVGEIDLMHIPAPGAEPRELCHISLGSNPDWASYDAQTGLFAYTLQRAEADIYLAQPATDRQQN